LARIELGLGEPTITNASVLLGFATILVDGKGRIRRIRKTNQLRERLRPRREENRSAANHLD
jgi:hypothetical protein